MRWFSQVKRRTKQSARPFQETSLAPDAVAISSVASSLTTIEGRQFLTEAPYALPKDGEEINRLDLQYYMLRYARRGIFSAPLTQPEHILDVGCGTGRWGQDMARIFPQAEVVGLDLVDHSSNQPGFSPPINYRFHQGNVLKGLPFSEGTFDFVHQSMLYFAIPASSWERVVHDLVRVTRHEGWIELLEGEVVFRQGGPACQQLAQWARDIAQLNAIDLKLGASIALFLQKVGCQHIQSQEIAIPIGEWGKHLGKMAATDLLSGARALKPVVLSRFHINEEQFEQVMQDMQREWQERRCSLIFYSSWAQRA